MIALWFALAAAIGAVARYAASTALRGDAGTAVATLYLNVAGSFVLGLLANRGADTLTVVGVGGLGALTTFSTFVLVTVDHLDHGRSRQAATYTAVMVLACTCAAWLGLSAADQGWT